MEKYLVNISFELVFDDEDIEKLKGDDIKERIIKHTDIVFAPFVDDVEIKVEKLV